MTAEPIAYELSSLSGPTDGALAHEHLSGAEEAFAELYRRYYPRLVRLCTRRTGDAHLAEDIAQETLVRALRYLSGFDTSRPMWPWLKTIASRIAYQATQKTAGERCSDLDQEDPEAYAVESPCHRIDDQLVLGAALDKVPARQRAALIMRYVDDWSTADSARFAGMTVPAFEQLLFRARRRLGTEYRRLTDNRRLGAFGGPALLASLKRLRTFLKTRADALSLGGTAVSTGLMGVASMSVAVTVMAAPPTQTLPLQGNGAVVTSLDASSALDQFRRMELAAQSQSLSDGAGGSSLRGSGSRTSGNSGVSKYDRLSYQLGPGKTDNEINKHPAGGRGKVFRLSVSVDTPAGRVYWEAYYDHGDDGATVECYDLECNVTPPGVPPVTR